MFLTDNNAYILVRGDIIITENAAAQVALKNCATFIECITKIDGTTINDAEDSDLVIPIHCKAKLLPNTVAQPAPNNITGILKKITTSVSSKNLSNFWRSLEIPLINCKVELKLKWT